MGIERWCLPYSLDLIEGKEQRLLRINSWRKSKKAGGNPGLLVSFKGLGEPSEYADWR